MIRMTFSASAVFALVVFGAVPGYAQGHHAGPPPTHVTHAASPSHGGSHATHAGKSNAAHGPMTPAQHLQKSPQLAQKLAGLLPAGTTLDTAASGFKNFGQFVAAVHVSHNLGLSFQDVKDLMTGPKHESLGQAVQSLKPGSSNDAVKQAETEAKDDLAEAASQQKAEQAKAKAKSKPKPADGGKD